jgi:hypothetical protein
VSARWRDRRGELLDQLERLEDERRRAVAPAALEPVEQMAVVEPGEPLAGEGRVGDVTAKPLEPLPIVGRNGDRGMGGTPGAA